MAERGGGFTCSKGPQAGIVSWAAAARTQLLYVGRTHALSNQQLRHPMKLTVNKLYYFYQSGCFFSRLTNDKTHLIIVLVISQV